jgi:anti-sigma factor RsiW
MTRERRETTHGLPSPHCRALIEEFSRHLDGELTAARRRELERHLAGCDCCEELAARLRLTVAACRAAEADPMPAAVQARARSRVRALLAGMPRAAAPVKSRSRTSRSKK